MVVLQVVAVELELDGEVLRVEGVVGRAGARGRLQGVEGGVEVRVEDELVAFVVRDRIRYGERVRLAFLAVPAEAPRGGQAAVPVGVALGALLHERLDVLARPILEVVLVLLELDGHVLREDRVVLGRRHRILNVVSGALVSNFSCWHVPSVFTDPPAATSSHDAASSAVLASALAPSSAASSPASTPIKTIFMAGSA